MEVSSVMDCISMQWFGQSKWAEDGVRLHGYVGAELEWRASIRHGGLLVAAVGNVHARGKNHLNWSIFVPRLPVTSIDKFFLQVGGLEHMVMVHMYIFFFPFLLLCWVLIYFNECPFKSIGACCRVANATSLQGNSVGSPWFGLVVTFWLHVITWFIGVLGRTYFVNHDEKRMRFG